MTRAFNKICRCVPFFGSCGIWSGYSVQYIFQVHVFVDQNGQVASDLMTHNPWSYARGWLPLKALNDSKKSLTRASFQFHRILWDGKQTFVRKTFTVYLHIRVKHVSYLQTWCRADYWRIYSRLEVFKCYKRISKLCQHPQLYEQKLLHQSHCYMIEKTY